MNNKQDFIVTDNINPKQVLLQRQIEEKMYESFPIKPKTTESIPERITRIRGELDEVEKVLKYSKLQGTILSVDCENANLYQQLKLLEKQYQELVSTKEYNKLLSSSNKEQAEAIQAAKTLSTQMNNTIAQLKSFVVTAHKPNDPSKTVIELYQSKSTMPTGSNSRLTALESRLKLLEGKVGSWNKQVFIYSRSIQI
jgi:acyl-homoserine lactone acylase PvdQ